MRWAARTASAYRRRHFPAPLPAKNSQKEGLPSVRGLTTFPNYFADAVLTAGGNNSWLRAATQ
jgi:hypothetical protein